MCGSSGTVPRRSHCVGVFDGRLERLCMTLLKGRHFNGSEIGVSLGGDGLFMEVSVDAGMRSMYIEGFDLDDDLLGKDDLDIHADREASVCKVNPRETGLVDMLKSFQDEEDSLGLVDEVNSGYGMDRDFERIWGYNTPERMDDESEGQRIVTVCFFGARPVGHMTCNLDVMHDKDDKEVRLSVTVNMVYVRPTERGRGFGMDLSIAGRLLLEDVMQAVNAATPKGHSLLTTLSAQYSTAFWAEAGGVPVRIPGSAGRVAGELWKARQRRSGTARSVRGLIVGAQSQSARVRSSTA